MKDTRAQAGALSRVGEQQRKADEQDEQQKQQGQQQQQQQQEQQGQQQEQQQEQQQDGRLSIVKQLRDITATATGLRDNIRALLAAPEPINPPSTPEEDKTAVASGIATLEAVREDVQEALVKLRLKHEPLQMHDILDSLGETAGVSFVPPSILLKISESTADGFRREALGKELQAVRKNVQVVDKRDMANLGHGRVPDTNWLDPAKTAQLPNVVYYINFVTTNPEKHAEPAISYNGQVDLLNEKMLVQMCRNRYDFDAEAERRVVSLAALERMKVISPSETQNQNASPDEVSGLAALFESQIRGSTEQPRKVVLHQFQWRKSVLHQDAILSKEYLLDYTAEGQQKAVQGVKEYLRKLGKIGDVKYDAAGGFRYVSQGQVLRIECATPSSENPTKNAVFREIDIFFRFIKGATEAELRNELKGFRYTEDVSS
ncbi:unnamed protein product [Amoebophrya sp. A25]|nr:unnamed protein product [Amoebophrya sp. A25]|eukprot:GSA25T00005573001.1